MTSYESKLVSYLSEAEIVSDKKLKKLIKIRKKYREKGKDLDLDELLLAAEEVSEEELERIRTRLKKDETPDVESDGEAGDESPTSSRRDRENNSSPSNGQTGRRATASSEQAAFEESAENEKDDPGAGNTIPGYRIKGVLGKGGTATVFEAEPEESVEARALKVLYPRHLESPSQVRQFRREGQLLMEFEHPHIVEAYSLDQHEGVWFLELELLEGETLLSRIHREGALPESRALDVVVEIADALQYMQDQGYVHRDVKSENVMLLEEGSTCIFDLGFAQEIGSEPDLDEGETQGTVYYMSPEQACGQKELDVRSDIYSLGVTLYQMAVGELPFEGDEAREVMAKQVREKLKGEKVKQELSSHLHYVIEKMMSKEKDFRFQTPGEIIEEISSFREAQEQMEYEPDPSDTDINPI